MRTLRSAFVASAIVAFGGVAAAVAAPSSTGSAAARSGRVVARVARSGRWSVGAAGTPGRHRVGFGSFDQGLRPLGSANRGRGPRDGGYPPRPAGHFRGRVVRRATAGAAVSNVAPSGGGTNSIRPGGCAADGVGGGSVVTDEVFGYVSDGGWGYLARVIRGRSTTARRTATGSRSTTRWSRRRVAGRCARIVISCFCRRRWGLLR